MTNRPPRRTLVRWNDDHDKELLLWIAYCCNEQGIRIPFDRIAQCMGPSFTAGACIQHLAKIRTRMEEQGLHVPPAQKRGTVTRAASSIYRPNKAKELNLPVPRVRPEVSPTLGVAGIIEDEDSDEGDQHQGYATLAIANTPRKTIRRQATAAKTPTTAKYDSDEDETEPALYDSDNEYGAKRPSEPPTTQSPLAGATLAQKKLAFGQSKVQQGSQVSDSKGSTMNNNNNYHVVGHNQDSPQIKYEASETLESMQEAHAAAKKPRGTRRKSSALTAVDEDENDDEYDPGSQGKGRKKPRARATKKPKTNAKESASEAQDRLARSIGYQNASGNNADRDMMPPPPRPNVAANTHANTYVNSNPNAGYGVAWNNQFMDQPFGASNNTNAYGLSNYGGQNTSEGGWNDYSPAASSQYNDLAFLQDGAVHNTSQSAFAAPPIDYFASGMPSTHSSPAARNHSWASVTSTSTVESQPGPWAQPRRTGVFPNPREASAVLQKMMNTEGADASTRVDIFGAPLTDAGMQNTLSQSPIREAPSQNGRQDVDMDANDPDSLFVGEPELFGDDNNLYDWFNEGTF